MSKTLKLATGADPSFLQRIDRRIARSIIRRPAVLTSRRPVLSISFDDIPESAATVGAKVLEEECVRGTFYISAGLLTNRFGPWRFASMDQVVALHEAGHEIGCHTFSHPDSQILLPSKLRSDIAKNGEMLLAAMPDLELKSFAYPYGSVGRRQKLRMLDVFQSARGVHPAINANPLDVGQLSSFTLTEELTPLARMDELIAETLACNGWLIVHTHDVANKPTSQGCTPQLLRSLIRHAKRAGFAILPIGHAMKLVEYQGEAVSTTSGAVMERVTDMANAGLGTDLGIGQTAMRAIKP